MQYLELYGHVQKLACVGRRTQKKKSEFQMGIELTTLRTLIGCSNHCARLLLSVKSAHENAVTVQVVPCMEGPFLLEDD